MNRYLLMLACIGALIAPTLASAQEQKLLVRDPSTGAEVYLTEAGDFIELRSIAPASMWIAYEIDVNQNGVVDRMVDLRFAFNACSAYRYTASSSSGCGAFKTAGSYSEEVIGSQKVTKWRIPRRELSVDGNGFGISVEFYDSIAKVIRTGGGAWRFGGTALVPEPPPPLGATPKATLETRAGPVIPLVAPPVAKALPPVIRPAFETVVARDDGNGVTVYASETKDDLEFRSEGPASFYINYHVLKVIGLNKHDLDRVYGTPWGRSCASIRLSVNSWTSCGQAYGKFSTETVGTRKITRWRIAKRDISSDGFNFGVAFQLWDDGRKVARGAARTYRFGVGLVSDTEAGLAGCPGDLAAARGYLTGILVKESRNNPLMAEKTTVYSADRYVLGAKALTFYEVDNGFSVSLTFVLPGEPQDYARAWNATYGARPVLDPNFCGKSDACFHWKSRPEDIRKGSLYSATLYKNFTVNPTFTCTYSALSKDEGW